jgi:(4-(4-[2-(gamma-L-glutamylamino)ethyl]phenoxymethyl)furan-2-yl)methanamine synthase
MGIEQSENGGAMTSILGWDIGAANIKAAWVDLEQNRIVQRRVCSRPYEIWREKESLPLELRAAVDMIACDAMPEFVAITMTAELSDAFSTKREGVAYVLGCVKACFPDAQIFAFNISGDFMPLDEALADPLAFAATNWAASALWISRKIGNGLFIDMGSTTTDIVPILDGKPQASGKTDTERLISGELVYTGVLRTNVAAIVQSVPIKGIACRVASEYFAVSGDVHLVLGNLDACDYVCSTPDGRAPSIETARARLARVVCADVEMLSADEIDELARFVCEKQIQQVCDGIVQVLSRLPRLRLYPAATAGIGAFLALEAAHRCGLQTLEFISDWNKQEQSTAPCLAVAQLLAERLFRILLSP